MTRKLELSPYDKTFSYRGTSVGTFNYSKNPFTDLWTFDLRFNGEVVKGVPITGGSNVVKGNGTPFDGIVFSDPNSTNGDIEVVSRTEMLILEK